MKTKPIATTLLLCFVGLAFSGCSTRYVPQKCTIDKPTQTAPNWSCTAKYPNNDYKYAECVADKLLLLEQDYATLEKAFDGCK